LPLPLCRNLREVGVLREQHPPYRCRTREQLVVRHPPYGVFLGGKATQDGIGARIGAMPELVPATKSGQDASSPIFGGWHLFPPGERRLLVDAVPE